MRRVVSRMALDPVELWLYYASIGGASTASEIEGYLSGTTDLPREECDLLAYSANRMISNLEGDTFVPYSSGIMSDPGASPDLPAPSTPVDPLSPPSAAGRSSLTAEEREAARLASLRMVHLVDSPAEARFDRITAAAREVFDVHSAYVALVAEDRQFLKSVAGSVPQNIPRTDTFCHETIKHTGPMIVTDALKDPRFKQKSIVVGEPHVRFYAGYPLRGPGGWNIGTLCVIDQRMRTFPDAHARALRDYAHQVQDELDTRSPT
jgi:hypothetical protein